MGQKWIKYLIGGFFGFFIVSLVSCGLGVLPIPATSTPTQGSDIAVSGAAAPTVTLVVSDNITLSLTPIIQEDPMTPNQAQPDPTDPTIAKQVTQVKEDLAQQLSIAPDQINLVAVEFMVWPDASMGCPRPDMAYAQVLQDGMRIQLRVGQKIYHYHRGGNRPFFLCENPAKIGGDSLAPRPDFND